MITHCRASPGTSIPSQNVPVPEQEGARVLHEGGRAAGAGSRPRPARRRDLPAGEPPADQVADAAQGAVAGEEAEGPAAQPLGDAGADGGQHLLVAGVVVGRDVGDEDAEGLAEVVEGGRQRQLLGARPEPEPFPNESEVPGDGQGRRGQHHRPGRVKDPGAEAGAGGHRGVSQLRLLGAQLHPGDVAGPAVEEDVVERGRRPLQGRRRQLQLLPAAVRLGKQVGREGGRPRRRAAPRRPAAGPRWCGGRPAPGGAAGLGEQLVGDAQAPLGAPPPPPRCSAEQPLGLPEEPLAPSRQVSRAASRSASINSGSRSRASAMSAPRRRWPPAWSPAPRGGAPRRSTRAE